MKNLKNKALKEAKIRELTLYHRTSPESANSIKKTGIFKSREEGNIFFSNRKNGQNKGYGNSVIKVKVPKHHTNLDDEFPNGEKHYSVNQNNLTKKNII